MKKIKEFFNKNATELKVGIIIGTTAVISYVIGKGEGNRQAIDTLNDVGISLYLVSDGEKKEIETQVIDE